MANYQGHLKAATFFYLFYFAFLAYLVNIAGTANRFHPLELWGYAALLLGICLLFGLWPDIDIYSKGQKIFYTIFFAIDIYLIYTEEFKAAAYFGLITILPILSKHRGWTHTWWAMFIVPSPFLLIPIFYMPDRKAAGIFLYGAAVVGYFSHLFADGFFWKRNWKRK